MCLPLLFLTACGNHADTLYDSDQYETISINESFVPEADEVDEGADEEIQESPEKETDLEELFSHGAGVFSWDHLPTPGQRHTALAQRWLGGRP